MGMGLLELMQARRHRRALVVCEDFISDHECIPAVNIFFTALQTILTKLAFPLYSKL